MGDYGKIDILWLDGGQVCKREGLEIKLGDAVAELRKINPELIVVDRTVGVEHENYITPEQTIPEAVISVPWESGLTLCRDFNYIYAVARDAYPDIISCEHRINEVVCLNCGSKLSFEQKDKKVILNTKKTTNDKFVVFRLAKVN